MKSNSPLQTARLLLLSTAILPLLLFTHCKRDGQVLASFDGGDVTRKELRYFFEVLQQQTKATVELQDRALKNLALLKITASEARKAGIDKEEQYKKQMSLFDPWLTLSAYDYHLKQNMDRLKFTMISMQFLFLAPKTGSKGEKISRTTEANDLLNQLNNAKGDGDIEKLIGEKTENQRYKPIAGYLDPHCISCSMNPLSFLTDPLKTAPDGKFVLVEDSQGYWLIRKVSQKEVDGDDLQSLFESYHKKVAGIAEKYAKNYPEGSPNRQPAEQFLMKKEQLLSLSEQQAQGQLKRESGSLIQNKIETLKKEKAVKVFPIAMQPDLQKGGLKETTPIFSIGDTVYTLATIKQTIQNSEIQNTDLINVAVRMILPYELLKDDEEVKQAKKGDLSEFLGDLRKNEILSNLYLLKKIEEPQIKEVEIRQMYDAAKQQFHNAAYATVREQIKTELINRRKQEAYMKIQDDLSKKFHLTIQSDLLKPDSI